MFQKQMEWFRHRSRRAARWWPSIFRGGIYVVIAYLTVVHFTLKPLKGSEIALLGIWDWTKMHIEASLSALIVLRAYMDNSHDLNSEELRRQDDGFDDKVVKPEVKLEVKPVKPGN